MTPQQAKEMIAQRSAWLERLRAMSAGPKDIVEAMRAFEAGWAMAQGIPIRDMPGWAMQPGVIKCV